MTMPLLLTRKHWRTGEICQPKIPSSTIPNWYTHSIIMHMDMCSILALGQVIEAAEVEKEAVSHYCCISQMEISYKGQLCGALHNYGWCCPLLRQHAEAILAFKE